MKLLTFRTLRSLRLSGRGYLFLGTTLSALVLGTTARADDDIVSRMEQEMSRLQAAQAHVQEEQRAINHDMAVLKAEIARHHASGTSASHASPSHDGQLAAARPDGRSDVHADHGERITTASTRRHGLKTAEAPQFTATPGEMTAARGAEPLRGAVARRDRVSLSPTGRGLIDTDKGSELAVVG
ncbi:MAG: hypothetical protein ABF761_10765, partial [Gluconobacter potus]